jgi:hypothetical protein
MENLTDLELHSLMKHLYESENPYLVNLVMCYMPMDEKKRISSILIEQTKE